jgi:hypothetical protein
MENRLAAFQALRDAAAAVGIPPLDGQVPGVAPQAPAGPPVGGSSGQPPPVPQVAYGPYGHGGFWTPSQGATAAGGLGELRPAPGPAAALGGGPLLT